MCGTDLVSHCFVDEKEDLCGPWETLVPIKEEVSLRQ